MFSKKERVLIIAAILLTLLFVAITTSPTPDALSPMGSIDYEYISNDNRFPTDNTVDTLTAKGLTVLDVDSELTDSATLIQPRFSVEKSGLVCKVKYCVDSTHNGIYPANKVFQAGIDGNTLILYVAKDPQYITFDDASLTAPRTYCLQTVTLDRGELSGYSIEGIAVYYVAVDSHGNYISPDMLRE